MSQTSSGHCLLRALTTTCAMKSGCRRACARVSSCKRSVVAQPTPVPGWSIRFSPTGRSSIPLRSRIAGDPYELAVITTRRAPISLPSARTTPVARSPSSRTRSTSASPQDRQVGSRPRGIEIGEGGVPARRSDRVDRKGPDARAVLGRVVEPRQPELVRRVEHGSAEWRQLLGREAPRAHRFGRTVEVRLELVRRPARAPLVVVGGRAGKHRARIVGRAAAQDARPQLRAVVRVAPLP